MNDPIYICSNAETDRGIFEQVLKGVLDFHSEPWPRISESAKDLIRNMLNPSPSARFTAYQVLCKDLEFVCIHLLLIQKRSSLLLLLLLLSGVLV